MRPQSICPELTRQRSLQAQLLDGSVKLNTGREGAAQVVEKLGYVQIDTISVVERAPSPHPLDTLFRLPACRAG